LVLAHRLAAAVLAYQAAIVPLRKRLRVLASSLADLEEPMSVPESFAALCALVERVEGVRLRELAGRLEAAGAPSGERALAEVLRMARQLPEYPEVLARWDTRLIYMVAAAGGDQRARAGIEPELSRLAETDDWAALAKVLRRVLEGERDQRLLAGLDLSDTVIVTELLRRLGGSS